MKTSHIFGNFISLEGIDFTWKTPFSQWLKRDLTAQGMKVILTRDPPYYISPWNQFREFFESGENLALMSEAFLLLTARLDNFERVILPALKSGHVIVSDRYVDSWLAYQSIRLSQYFKDHNHAMEFLILLQDDLVSKGLLGIPSLTIWISESPEVAIKRASTAEKISKYENLPIQQKVDKQYQFLSKRYSRRIKVVDVRGLDIHAAYRRVLGVVTSHLSKGG
ncbi:MAG TPA: hypothetical protein VJB92_03315 [Candidatus Paceibacterota bacterium]